MRHRSLLLTCVAATILTLLGCASAATSPADSEGWVVPEIEEDAPPIDPSFALPADSYRLSDEQRAVMGEAQERLLVACAAEFGVDMQFIGDYVRKPDNSGYYWGGLYGTMTEEHANSHGYLAAPTGPWKTSSGFTLSSPTKFAAYTSDEVGPRNQLLQVVALGPETQTTIPASDQVAVPRDGNGSEVPPGGCAGIVERQIGVPLDTSLDDDLFQLMMLSRAQRRVAQAESEWISCMTRATGETFAAVSEAWVQGARPETAVADVQCTQESRWPDFFYPVLADYQQQMIQKEPERFEGALATEQKRFEALMRGGAHG